MLVVDGDLSDVGLEEVADGSQLWGEQFNRQSAEAHLVRRGADPAEKRGDEAVRSSAAVFRGGNLQFGTADCPGVAVGDPFLDAFYIPEFGSPALTLVQLVPPLLER